MRTINTHLLIVVLSAAAGNVARAEDATAPLDLTTRIAGGPPMTADEAAARAERAAPALARAQALTRAAEAAVARSRAQLLPRLELGARYTHVDGFADGTISIARDPDALAAARMLADRIDDPAARTLWIASLEQPATPKIEIPRDQAALSARISWPVSDLFFAIAPAIDAARAGVRAAEAQHAARRARVRLSARESYYQLVRARGALAVAERAVLQARAQQERIDAGVRAGMRPRADGTSAMARRAAAEQAVASAEASVDVADAALRTLLQDEEGAPYGIVEPIFDAAATSKVFSEPAPTKALLALARAQRAEVRTLRETIAAHTKGARAAKASGLPHLGVYAGADYARPNRYVIPPAAAFQPSWEIGASLTYAPNDTLVAAHRERENRAQVDALEADLAELEQSLTLEIRRARAGLVRAARAIEAARAAERAAEEAYASRLAELAVGAAVTADLFAAEADLNRARLDALDAVVDQRIAHARLAYAVGD